MTGESRYHADDVLTVDQLADRLQVPVRTVRGLDAPRFRVGREVRYFWGDVVSYLEDRGAAGSRSAAPTGRGVVYEARRERGT